MNKVIIVEGKSDRERLLSVLDENVEIICTNGTLNDEAMERLSSDFKDGEIYVLTDADAAGNALRRKIKTEISYARHLYTRKIYREIATTPLEYLTEMLQRSHFAVKPLESVRNRRPR